MPTYDYVCQKCEKQFEVFQSMNDKPLTKCPEKGCRGKVKRLLGTGAGLIFRGSGFYITDYRSDSYKSAAKADSSSASASSASSSGGDSGGSSTKKEASARKSEPKPAAKKKAT